MGGDGSPRSFRLAAKYADEFNLTGASPEQAAEKQAALDEVLRAAGRDPKTMARSVMVGIAIGVDQAEFEGRVTALQDAFALESAKREGWVEARRPRMILGTPDEARAMVRRYADAGIERLMLQDFLPFDLEMVDLMAAELVGKL